VRSAPVAQARANPAWCEQCWAIAVMVVLLNWITTGDHLPKTLTAGYWPVAGVDLLLLTGAVIAALTGCWLSRRVQVEPVIEQDTLAVVNA